MMRKRLTLNGTWNMAIHGRKLRNQPVPSSYFGVGPACLEREIPPVPHESSEQVHLCFDGIANSAQVEIDGLDVGCEMLPFVPYRFDVTPLLESGCSASLKVTIRDFDAPFGYSPGWETYGGIIRDVYLEVVNRVTIEDAHVVAKLSEDYLHAACQIEVFLRNASSKQAGATLTYKLFSGSQAVPVVSSTKKKISLPPAPDGSVTVQMQLNVSNVALWSPEAPNLYRLVFELGDQAGGPFDSRTDTSGFREFKIAGRRFFLNGRPVFLKGVCRHDMWQGQGYTLTRGQMEADMRSMKRMGANFVRLVHYPNHRYVVDLAEKLGLMVTEEPGLWNIRRLALTTDQLEAHKESSIEVMRKTIRRDRNSPAVIAWLLGNECYLDSAFLKKSKKSCRALDPERPISFSDVFTGKAEDAKKPYIEAGLDFYDVHPYTATLERFKQVMKTFNDKPLIFGEWGGWWCRNNEGLLRMFGDCFAEAAAFRDDDEEHLNGIAYWEWADMRQYGRGFPGCEDGVLTEGLVTEGREEKPDYYVMRAIFEGIDSYRRKAVEVYPRISVPAEIASYRSKGRLQCVHFSAVADRSKQRQRFDPGFPVLQTAHLSIGTVPFTPGFRSGMPIALSLENPEITIPIEMNVTVLHFLGHVAVRGYPVAGEFEQSIAEYVIHFDNGTEERVDLRNGIHFAQSNIVHEGSRLEPVAIEAPVVIECKIEADYNISQVRYFRYVLRERPAEISRIRFKLNTSLECRPLLYGLTLELA